ncbi:molybdotransferase-like divisome protein Glp [Bounagaea algeriensis]
MRSVDEQLARVLTAAVRPAPVRVGIFEAQGMLCAEEVVAEHALPGFDQAAVDGCAVRSVDVRGAVEGAPVLPVVGEIAAGSNHPHRLQPGQAAAVATGAPLPTLADAVVPWEEVEQHEGHENAVSVLHPVPSRAYVRRTGEDVQPGDVAVQRGSPIGPAQVGLLAAVGREKVLVHPRPRVSVISLGEELVDVDRTPGAGQVYDVNSYALAAAARDAGADVTRVGALGGDHRRLREVVEGRLLLSEVVVIAGGGGKGNERVRTALSDLGEMDLTRVAMQPGSVQGFGRLGPDRVPTFVLPSNPVSALAVFEVMVRPMIRSALGKANPHRRTIAATLLSPLSSPAGRQSHIRGQLLRDPHNGSHHVQPVGTSGVHLLATLAEANCLIVLAPEVTEVDAGDEVDVRFLSVRS